jgi:3-oxoacyl-[acyl-carrier protein] reductase
MRLAGLNAVVTGAASGLGAAAARRFATEGARVIVSDVDRTRAEVVARHIGEAGGFAHAVACDVSDAAQCRALICEAERILGSAIDIFHANAGVAFSGDFTAVDPTRIERVIAVNLTGAAFCAQAALRSLVKSENASLLFTASLQSVLAKPRRSIYTATKHAIVGLVKGLALEYGPAGVRVNAIAPGSIDTPLLRQQLAAVTTDVAAAVSEIAGNLPLRRMATEADFADAALFLASREARAITGHTLLVDCGAAAGPT